MCGFIAQLVEHSTGIAEVTGLNPVEELKFLGFFFTMLKLKNLLQWSLNHWPVDNTFDANMSKLICS